MEHPLSVTLAGVHMISTENDVVKPVKPLFYKRYVDVIYSGREKNIILISYYYYPNLKLMIEVEEVSRSFPAPKLLKK